MMEIYPAIDLSAGRCVRLYQGDFDTETVYDDDPVSVAQRFCEEGARWLHVVDLEAARSGELANLDVVEAIVERVEIPVQYGGGVRSPQAARQLQEAGVKRLVVGTAALERPELLGEIEGSVALGLDVRGREVAVRGWRTGSLRSIAEVLGELFGLGASDPTDDGATSASGGSPVLGRGTKLNGPAAAGATSAPEGSPALDGRRPDVLIVTQIARDGTLRGPDFDLLSEVLALSDIPLIASGGVGDSEDVAHLAELSHSGRCLAGVIVGKALYEGRASLPELITAASTVMD